MRQLRRRHSFCETPTRTRHDIVSGLPCGNLAFQAFEQRCVGDAIQHHGIGNCRPRSQQTL
jgi:hypothetical protein